MHNFLISFKCINLRHIDARNGCALQLVAASLANCPHWWIGALVDGCDRLENVFENKKTFPGNLDV
jgi:hypothetical protein